MTIKEIQKRLKKHSKHLSFDEPSHRYFFDDGKQKFECTSATTFLGLLKDGGEKMTSEEEKEHWYNIAKNLKPSHELFGRTPEEILAIWNVRNNASRERGTALHNYIEFNLTRFIRPNDEKVGEEEYRWKRNEFFPNELESGYFNFKNDCVADTRKFGTIDEYNAELPEGKLGIIGLEVRVVVPRFRISGTFDALFLMKWQGKYLIFIYDWKTNKWKDDEPFDYSRWKYEPPFDFLTKDHLTDYTMQVWLYRYILEEEYGIPIDGARVVWFHEKLPKRYKIWKPKFEYDKDFIEEILAYNLKWNHGN